MFLSILTTELENAQRLLQKIAFCYGCMREVRGSKQTSHHNSTDIEVQAEELKALDNITDCTSPEYPSIRAQHGETDLLNPPKK